MNNKNKGFTLIELLIYIATFSFVLVFLITFVLNLIGVQAKIKINKEVLENNQRAMETMLSYIKESQDIYTSTSYFDNHPGQLSLETRRNTPEGEEVTYLDFYLDENERICFKEEGSDAIALTSEKVRINNMIFNYLIDSNNNKSIRIELSAVYRNSSNKIDYQATSTLISTANLRND